MTLALCFWIPASAQEWQRLGPLGGNVISLAADANGTVYLGAADGHVFASEDRGEHWQLRGRVGDRRDAVVQRIIPDLHKPDRVLAAVWFLDASSGGGIFESNDAAKHWHLAGLEAQAVRALEHSRSDPDTWLAGTRTGVFRSVDDGSSWQRITPAEDPELQNIDSLAIDPQNPRIIYVGTYHLPWKTTDGGKTWKSIASGMIDDSDIMSLRIDEQNPQRIFSSACSGIYRSDDAGASWVKLQGIPYGSRRTQRIVQDPRNAAILYAATTAGLWQTNDAGENWQRVSATSAVANDLVILPIGSGTRILAGMEAQGILRSDDAAKTFTLSNNGFFHRVVISAAAESDGSSHLLARIEGFSVPLAESRDAGVSWTEFPAVPRESVARIFRLPSGWWIAFAPGGAARFDEKKRIWKSVAFREFLQRKKTARPSATGRSIMSTHLVTPAVDSVAEFAGAIFVGTASGLWRLNPQANEFRQVAVGLLASISDLEPGPENSLLAVAGNSIWRRTASSEKWVQLTPPPNAGHLLWARSSPVQGESLFVGTEKGVFVANAPGGWKLLGNGLPALASAPPAFSDLAILISMANAGMYRSQDQGNSWRRVDSAGEQGTATAIFVQANNFVIASRSEGFLRYAPKSHSNPDRN